MNWRESAARPKGLKPEAKSRKGVIWERKAEK